MSITNYCEDYQSNAPVSAVMEQTWLRQGSFPNIQLKWLDMNNKKFLPP